YELNGGTNDKGNPDSYTVEDSVTFKNPTRNGYDFLGWYSDPNGKAEIKSIPSGSSGEVKVYALWKPVTYPVKYELNGGVNDKSNPSSYTVESETLTIKDALKDHYDFKGWKEGNQIPKGSTGEKLFTALFEAKAYPITYVLNGGTNDKTNPVSYTIESEEIVIKDPSRNGYKFTGWKEGNKIPKGSSGDKTFTAQWEAVPYAITYVLEGGLNDKDNPSSYTIESKDIDLKDPTKEGYKFIGWKEGNKIPSGSTGDKTFTAQWEVVPYTITYVLDGGVNDKSNPSTYTIESQEIKLKDPTKTGYDFVGWKEGDVIPKGSSGDKTFTAQFKPVSYGITYDMDGGTNSSDNPLNYTIESPTITLKTPTKKGYSFISWVEGNQIPSGSTGVKHFTASWKIENYPVTFLGFNKAEVSKQSVTYNEKASRVEAPGVTDYYFDGWYYDEAFTKKYSFDDPIVGETILYGSYKPIFKVKETSVEVQKYTEDECGNVKDEWGNIIYTGTKCPVKKTSYTLPNTGETNPLVSGGFATLLVTCLTPVLAVMKKLK
ncbi:MAG: InlB B-repeat-containing protein, partial [Erysipelotrichaceae bacterium]|nr:InlB B-repeat-containing protein [Erysipelotrichaceae bacterium]